MTMADRIVVLNDGRLQQVDTPKQIYHRPENLFVADFIGSPSMNFFDVHVDHSGENATLVHEAFEYELSSEVTEALAEAGGADDLTLGIRPEDVRITDQRPASKTIEGTVEVVEVVGSDNFIYLDVGGKELRLRTGSEHEPAVGSTIDITFHEGSIHLFDGNTEEALVHGRDVEGTTAEVTIEQQEADAD